MSNEFTFQVITGKNGVFQQQNIPKKSMTVAEYRTLAGSALHKSPKHFDFAELEKKFWKNITYNNALYGVDVSGSLMDQDVEVCVESASNFNLK